MSLSLGHHAAALGFVAADIMARGARTRCLLPIPFFRSMMINTCGDAVSAITPGRIGGDPMRYLVFRRMGLTGPPILALFGLEIAAEALVLVSGAIILAILFRPAGHELLAASGQLLTSRGVWLILLALGALAIGSIIITRRTMSRGLAAKAGVSLRDAWRSAKEQPRRILLVTILLTLISEISRGAVLPALLAGTPGLDTGTLIVGSAVLLYGQLLAPTPAGIGAVELGAVASLAGHFPLGNLPVLILLWRSYTLVLGGVAGAGLLIWEALPRRRLPAVADS